MTKQQRKFALADQFAFAQLSGDNNPLHVDPIAARRLIFGEPVVHGIHLVLWALDVWLEGKTHPVNLRSIRAEFQRPIGLGKQVLYSSISDQAQRLEIELASGGSVSTRIVVEWDKSNAIDAGDLDLEFPIQHAPRIVPEDKIKGQSGSLKLNFNVAASSRLFPHLTKCVSPLQIAVLLGTTRLVGVECPGLNSVYSELLLRADNSSVGTGLNYAVEHYDDRFRRASIKVMTPGMIGTVTAFVRPTPQQQSSYLDLQRSLVRDEFSQQRALVVGGTRGLGEAVAKLLGAGGARLWLTYYRGEDDARRVIDEISSNGGNARSFHYDVLDPEADVFAACRGESIPTHLYYFATPTIGSAAGETFSTDLFSKFCDYYVSGFLRTVEQPMRQGLKNVFYPSTVYVDELPLNQGEYAAAKMAGEVLCGILEKKHPGTKIQRPRLPRMATDQTASLIPAFNPDPAPTMLAALRSFRDLS